MLIIVLGWIGNVFLVWSIWQLGNHRRVAHLLAMVGEAAWIGKCLLVSPPTWDLAFMCSVFFILAARCWVKWGSDAKTQS